MRVIATLMLSATSVAALAVPPVSCPYRVVPIFENVLSSAQRQATLDGKPNGDPVVTEAIVRLKARQAYQAPRNAKVTRLSWEKAKTLVLLGAVHATIEARDRTVWLVTPEGSVYETTRPNGVDLYALLNSVDPCSLYIDREILD